MIYIYKFVLLLSVHLANYLFLVPLAIFSEPVEHQVVALLREELGPVTNDRHSARGVAQAKLSAFFDKPKKI